MDFLEKKYGPITGRCWGLFINFFANGIAIHGAMRHMLKGESSFEMYLGIVLTVIVCMFIAIPVRD